MFAYQASSSGENPSREIIPMDNYVDPTYCPETVITESIDEIELRQKEMLDTVVLIQTSRGNGSATIIYRFETDIEGIFEYFVITNEHLTRLRFVTYLQDVSSLTGRIKTQTVDMGCEIITFDHTNKDWNQYSANVIAEDVQYDLAILSFLSNQELAVAQIADEDMLEQVRVFDEIVSIGCQLGGVPIPTTGIIFQIIIGDNGEKRWIIYGNTAQISPGSSGGALYKKYGDHYYLIGIPFSVLVYHDQLISHLAYAISIATARDFINQNLAVE
jgi:S1-C subfamily serine protease